MTLSGPVTLRTVTDNDSEFLFKVYSSTRAQEMAMVPWSAEQKDAFLRMQYTAQKTHYAAQSPSAEHDVILHEGMPVGRIYLDRSAEKLHILDLTVLPQFGKRGVGTFLLQQIMAESKRDHKPVTISVESFNPSLLWFLKLGFKKIEDKGIHCLLQWNNY